jgi:hypothetical protein
MLNMLILVYCSLRTVSCWANEWKLLICFVFTEWTWEREHLWPHLATMAELVRDIIHGYHDIMDNKSGKCGLSFMLCNCKKKLSNFITYEIKNQTDVTISILFIYRLVSTCFGPTGPSSGEFTQLFTQPLVQWLYRSGRVQSTRTERYSHWTRGCVNSCVNSPEDGPVGPKHVENRRYMNKIEIVTSVGF